MTKIKNSLFHKEPMELIAINPRYRITSGGSYKDFDDVERAIIYLEEKLKTFTYGSINKVYTFKKNER